MKYVVLLALVGMFWLFYKQNACTTKPTAGRIQAQEYMARLSITNFTAAGTPKEKIAAQSWAFIPSEGKSNLFNPTIIAYKENGDVWTMSAKRAFAWHKSLQDKIEQIDMLEQVIIKRGEGAKFTPTEITTEEMQYFPKEDKVISPTLVTMRQPDIFISGYGMLGYLDKNWVQLHDRTTTIYNQHTIKSKRAEFDNQHGTALYTKNVTVDNSTSHLVSDSLSIHRDSQNKIKTLIAHGKPATFTKQGDSVSGPVLTYDITTDTLHTKNSTVTLQPKQAS